jgi:hypothetical protein
MQRWPGAVENGVGVACGCESFDDDHRSTCRVVAVEGSDSFFGGVAWQSRDAPWQQGGAPSVGEEVEMADANEALGGQVR